jgi:cytochrome c oxidase subunit 1
MIGTVLGKQRAESDLPVAEAMAGGMPTPALLERWEIWVGLTIVLVIIAYGIPIAQLLQHAAPGSPGFVTW